LRDGQGPWQSEPVPNRIRFKFLKLAEDTRKERRYYEPAGCMRSSGSTAPKRGERLGPPGIPARDAETQPNLLVERLFPSSYWALNEEKAFVIVRASTTKNSKVAPMTLHPELVGVLREIKAESQPDELVLSGFHASSDSSRI
jgi:hypothetical protein